MYSASGSSEGAEREVEVEVVRGGKSSETAPANQSRLSEESGPPQWFCTARVRAGQRLRRREMPRSKVVWVCAGDGASILGNFDVKKECATLGRSGEKLI